jgi:hypothetical protein
MPYILKRQSLILKISTIFPLHLTIKLFVHPLIKDTCTGKGYLPISLPSSILKYIDLIHNEMRSSRVWMRSSRCGWDLAECGWDLAEWLERLTVNAVVATVLGSIQASSDIAESEGRQMKQCSISYIKMHTDQIWVQYMLCDSYFEGWLFDEDVLHFLLCTVAHVAFLPLNPLPPSS